MYVLCIYIRMYIHIYICMYMYVCMYVCMYACMHVCMYVCICTVTKVQILTPEALRDRRTQQVTGWVLSLLLILLALLVKKYNCWHRGAACQGELNKSLEEGKSIIIGRHYLYVCTGKASKMRCKLTLEALLNKSLEEDRSIIIGRHYFIIV
jgi:hypothetical protein